MKRGEGGGGASQKSPHYLVDEIKHTTGARGGHRLVSDHVSLA